MTNFVLEANFSKEGVVYDFILKEHTIRKQKTQIHLLHYQTILVLNLPVDLIDSEYLQFSVAVYHKLPL